MITPTVEVAFAITSELGEGALWDDRRQLLYWVDIVANKVYVYNPRNRSNLAYDVGQNVGTVVLTENDDLLLGLRNSIALLEPDTGLVRELSKPEREKTNTRFNDGKCDPRGRFWVGTLCERAPWNSGALYCLDTDGSIEIKLERIQCSNGLVWSRDEQTFYYIDTSTQEIWGFCYDAEKATLGDKRTVARIPKTIGSPDGMTIDEHDRLWVALWNGGRVICVEPKRGSVEFELPVPAQNVTSVAFGGSELDELYITTASVGLSADERRSQPLAGALFRSRLPFRGLPSRRYLGPICQ